jgi:type VI protein secretion system component VasK
MDLWMAIIMAVMLVIALAAIMWYKMTLFEVQQELFAAEDAKKKALAKIVNVTAVNVNAAVKYPVKKTKAKKAKGKKAKPDKTPGEAGDGSRWDEI